MSAWNIKVFIEQVHASRRLSREVTIFHTKAHSDRALHMMLRPATGCCWLCVAKNENFPLRNRLLGFVGRGGGGGGQVVSDHAFRCVDLSSNLAEVYHFCCKIVVENNENKIRLERPIQM